MLRDTAYCQENKDRFVRTAAEADEIYTLSCESGTAFCESTEQPDRDILLFFSDAAYARRALDQSFPEYNVEPIPVFDFLYRWLPGMSKDGAFVGPNWTGDLVGLEVDPFALRDEIENQLTPERARQFMEMYRKLANRRNQPE